MSEVVIAEGGAATAPSLRQQVLVLYLATSALTARVVSWAFYDGAGDEDSETGDNPEAPFATGLDALRAGWRLLSAAPILPASPGLDHVTSYQKFEFFFERMVVAPARVLENA